MFAELHTWLLTCLLLGAFVSHLAPAGLQLSSAAPALSPVALHLPLPSQQLTGSRAPDHYSFDVVFDYQQHRLDVAQQITYMNRHRHPLSELLLVVEPNRYTGVFALHALTAGERRLPLADWTLHGARLAIELPQALRPGAQVQLQLGYTLRLPARAGYFGYTQRQSNLGDWYPFIAALAADGNWLAYEPGTVGEHIVQPLADYAMTLSGPRLETVQIAAAAPAVKTERGLLFVLEDARNLAWSASPLYQTAARRVNGVTVTAYWFAEHAAAGAEALNATAQALDHYDSRFAPYPHQQMTSVEADFADGMEFDGLYFLGKEYYAAYSGQPTSYLTALSVHETAHQWWYALVGNDQALEPFLDEAFATYSELIFYEHYYPQLADWWWQYRVQRFAPTGCVNSTIYDHTSFRSYVNAVYLRGAQFLHELRSTMGDDAFTAFLQDYIDSNRAGTATAATLERSLRANFDGDPANLLQAYCLGSHVSPP